ncbi:MAG: DMT family transporter [Myxococcota bacterium]|jgi:drug/metabolite transporter (DMT)-like permease|nr:DMT family transporter [Myxococcota bacterium]MDP7074418.1 DMT family transporter [Myxococcota bacterium]MDP7300572.1 DMT family transporter [Myxococcota bacterium]MDP7434171.1 DMT family transporter [Myxococcota bacterium]HJO25400.1 DMT family transporter [Myxococcota bacterium]
MALHRTSGRRGLGAALASTTMLLWGLLPIGLEAILFDLDALTVTWARFVGSTLVLFAVLAVQRNLPPIRSLDRGRGGLLLVATLFLALNYGAYIIGLGQTSAADAQVVIQLAPVLLSAAGVLVFREPFTRLQWTGLVVLIGGLLLFVSGRDAASAKPTLLVGQALIVFAALTWVIYGLAQKQLLHYWGSAHIMLCIYTGCALAFTPFADVGSLARLDGVGWWLLAFCSANTIVGYGAFAEALEHWEASRVGAVLALVPLVTLALSALLAAQWPELVPAQQLSARSWTGALFVVAGSLLAALAVRWGR